VIGKWVSDNFRRRPMIIPVVVEVLPARPLLRGSAESAQQYAGGTTTAKPGIAKPGITGTLRIESRKRAHNSHHLRAR
jgi:hypothetical protein